MLNAYIAASFACDSRELTEQRKQEINDMVARLRKCLPEHNFYIPHEFVVPNAWNMGIEEWAQAVYDADIYALRHSQLIIFLSFGKQNNAGSAWECGCAYGYGIPVIMIRMTDNTESVMLYGSARAILDKSQVEAYDWKKLPLFTTPSLRKTHYTLS